MPRIPARHRGVDRSPRRPGLTFAMAALAALALAACGTEETSAGGARKTPADTVDTASAGKPPTPDQQVAFMDMLNEVGQPCTPDPPSEPEPTDEDEKPPTAPVEPLPVDESPPGDTEPTSDASTTPPEVKLNAIEKCEGRLHSERITKALDDLADPTPAQVRRVLNDLGYINERIHGLRRSGATTRFFVDLRVMGGSLCLDGSVTGTKSVVTAYAASATGPFTPAKRK
ncbi:hypothetical protein [Streptomyces sp. H51]|uniref:hypothetical protein n=1 Tax=Streptomyces sp. H51 TaxID=3111770 RepID=UPI002D76F5EA|nr:hypothetical protein [Streptomyces sp. H51]